MARTAFSLGIVAYAVAWTGTLVFVHRVFGMDLPAIILSLVLVVPLVVGAHLRCRLRTVSGREFTYLLILAILVSCGGALVIRNWYDNGMDSQHAEDMRFDEFARLARSDPAFHNIDFSLTNYKGRYVIRGTVASQADLERFLVLCDRYGFRFYAKDVGAISGNQRKSE